MRALVGVIGTAYATSFIHEIGAHVTAESGAAMGAGVTFIFNIGTSCSVSLTGVAAGASGVVGICGVGFIVTAGGVNIFLVATDLGGSRLGDAVFVLFFRESGIELIAKVVIEAALASPIGFRNDLAVFIINGANTLTGSESEER